MPLNEKFLRLVDLRKVPQLPLLRPEAARLRRACSSLHIDVMPLSWRSPSLLIEGAQPQTMPANRVKLGKVRSTCDVGT